jgi:hypothetical protein
MNPETFDSMDNLELEIPNPRKKENTPMPVRGDLVIFCVNERGLIAEATVADCDSAARPRLTLTAFLRYPPPILDPDWLEGRKGRTHEPIDTLAKRIGSARTETGGTIELSRDEMAELDHARRSHLSSEHSGA